VLKRKKKKLLCEVQPEQYQVELLLKTVFCTRSDIKFQRPLDKRQNLVKLYCYHQQLNAAMCDINCSHTNSSGIMQILLGHLKKQQTEAACTAQPKNGH
jgi:hypothetical protein